METSELVTILTAMFTGFGGLIVAAFKGIALIQKVGTKVDDSKEVTSDELEDLKKVVRLEMAKVHNEVSMITAKLAWTESAPEKTKKVMESAIEKMKDMHKSEREWVTSELLRVTEKPKGDKDEG